MNAIMNAIEIRAATPDDADAVSKYHDRCFTKSYSAQLQTGVLKAPAVEDTRQQLYAWFQPQPGLETNPKTALKTMVAVKDGAPIGHFTVQCHRLIHLFVDPDFHGTGLGRHLLEQAEAMIAAAGYTEFELHTRVDNLAGIAFYKKAGWRLTGQQIHTLEHDIAYDEHIMTKQIG